MADVVDEKGVKERIDYAKSLYVTALEYMDDVEKTFKGDYAIPQDIEDQSLEIVKPAKPRAIIAKMLAMLAIRAQMELEVVAQKTSNEEEERCSRLERWLYGYQHQAQQYARRFLYRDWVFWFLLRGRGDIELRFRPGDEEMPLMVLVDDPRTIYPVWGRKGILYYAKEYKVTAGELVRDFEGKQGWNIPPALAQKKFSEEVVVQEYWDEEQHAAFVEKGLIYLKPNPFGFIPLAEAKAEGTPLSAMEWASQGILYPVQDALKQQAILMSKVATAVEVFYWPLMIARDSGGRAIAFRARPGTQANLPPGATVEVIKPTPNEALVERLNAWLQGDINLMTIPEIAWGTGDWSQATTSGFAISQVLSQVMDRIEDKKENLEMAAGWHFGDLLRAIETLAPHVKDGKFSVMVRAEKKERRTALEIGAEDVEGHYRVDVTLNPELPSDRALNMQMATMARQPGADGKPLLPDTYLRRDILKVEEPDRVEEELKAQLIEGQIPEIGAKERRDYLEKWAKERGMGEEELAQLREEAAATMQPPVAGGEEMAGLPPELLPPQMQGEQYYPTEEELI